MNLPYYTKEFSITHNAHKSSYESIEDWLSFLQVTEENFLFPEDMGLSKTRDSLWHVQWYPHTPIGFYFAFGSTLEYALAKAEKIQLEIDKDNV